MSTGERLLSRAAFICWPVGGSSARNVFVEADCAGAEGAGDGEEGEEECGFHGELSLIFFGMDREEMVFDWAVESGVQYLQ